MKRETLFYTSLMMGVLCFFINGCDFLIKSEYVSYEYKKLGMELCGWERDKTISKIIVYKNKSNNIDLGIIQNNEMIPFGDKDSETLKQFDNVYVFNIYAARENLDEQLENFKHLNIQNANSVTEL